MDHITTPFGRRTLSLGMVAAQVGARDVEGKVAHKWKTFRDIAASKDALGVSDRTLAVLNALLTFLPETALSPGQLVVFPSNKALALRAHGMTETTLRRHLAALVSAGIVIRRDSPNGKRYARKDADGEVEIAFGFDLAPVLARAGEFEVLASEAAAARRAAMMARERITILRRDIGKMIQAGCAFGSKDEWLAFAKAYAGLCRRLPRAVTAELVEPLAADLMSLASTVGNALEVLSKTQNMHGNDGQNGAQIQNSKPKPIIEIEPAIGAEQEEKPEAKPLPLRLVLDACPDIVMYDRHGVKTWRDLIATAGMVRGMLGISASAWEQARDAMGEANAAAVVAGILQKAEAIKNPGGYLRGLTEKSRAGQFSAWPMMLALLRARSPISKSMSGSA
jgi:replication initiation protein RepC